MVFVNVINIITVAALTTQYLIKKTSLVGIINL